MFRTNVKLGFEFVYAVLLHFTFALKNLGDFVAFSEYMNCINIAIQIKYQNADQSLHPSLGVQFANNVIPRIFSFLELFFHPLNSFRSNNSIFEVTSPKGFSAYKCDVGNWIFSKSWEFWGYFLNFLGILWEFFLEFLGIVNYCLHV